MPAIAVALALLLIAWTPAPRYTPVHVHVLSSEHFELHRFLVRLPPGTRAFAVWTADGRCDIYLTPKSLNLIWDEWRHCQEGQFH